MEQLRANAYRRENRESHLNRRLAPISFGFISDVNHPERCVAEGVCDMSITFACSSVIAA